jgi:hypothetical protein
MRRWGLFGGIFWGVILIVLGITVLLNAVLHISIPIFSILFALLLCYIGVRLLTGRRGWSDHGVWFEHRHIEGVRAGDRHDVVFGSGSVDLTGVVLQSRSRRK